MKTRSNEFGDVQASSHERPNHRTLPQSHTALYSKSLSTIAYFKVLVLHTDFPVVKNNSTKKYSKDMCKNMKRG
ncbi:hypothetical protein GYH30_020146 [Glycine max]|uniref:Uncharacterized protein n=2 Tax=Glycine subgen. Soja TaxID=1462606 RepID=A0A0R0IQ65_SOYBN|nr:hypothetical protein GYH30_020146 [Glycine max]RZB95100.1 hypothetical protein D0Y65_019521 [Glycine soja]